MVEPFPIVPTLQLRLLRSRMYSMGIQRRRPRRRPMNRPIKKAPTNKTKSKNKQQRVLVDSVAFVHLTLVTLIYLLFSMCYCAIELFSPISLSKSFNFPICCMKMMKLEIYEITRGGRNFPKLSGSELPCTDTYQLTTIHGGKLRDSQKMCVCL